jgi:hypothetical protein
MGEKEIHCLSAALAALRLLRWELTSALGVI